MVRESDVRDAILLGVQGFQHRPRLQAIELDAVVVCSRDQQVCRAVEVQAVDARLVILSTTEKLTS